MRGRSYTSQTGKKDNIHEERDRALDAIFACGQSGIDEWDGAGDSGQVSMHGEWLVDSWCILRIPSPDGAARYLVWGCVAILECCVLFYL